MNHIAPYVDKAFDLAHKVLIGSISTKLILLGTTLISVGAWDILKTVAAPIIEAKLAVKIPDDPFGIQEYVGLAFIIIGLFIKLCAYYRSDRKTTRTQREEKTKRLLSRWKTMSNGVLQTKFAECFGMVGVDAREIRSLLGHPSNQIGAINRYLAGSRYTIFDGSWFAISTRWFSTISVLYFSFFTISLLTGLALLAIGVFILFQIFSGAPTMENPYLVGSMGALLTCSTLLTFADVKRTSAARKLVDMRPR
ncbi:hypothetical protein E5S70_24255 [Ensifer adhaerens]|uniref:hypothetical protein n=1 Tax=Ensifer canadensis TaxID=555315 RepID=UPI00148F5EFE|nr:hypothetical protein [Ensifer canadensis]NOV19156.1 hypothetical protein [Ensifer canadensis]